MTWLFSAFAALLVVILLVATFLRSSPAAIASGLRLAGPVVLGLLGALFMLVGRAGIGGGMIAAAVALFALWRNRGRRLRPTPGGRSHVRTAALEMSLDHDTGALEGMVLAGSFEGRELRQLGLEDLLALRDELHADSESLQLLETYLDGRFPVWREDVKTNAGGRERSAPGAGSMTKQEAYKILGLEPGASASDIRKAHRRLMQRLHPDVGGTSFLAARINEAKDVLLSDQD